MGLPVWGGDDSLAVMIGKEGAVAKVYSRDLRDRLIGAVEAGRSASAAGWLFKVSRSIAIITDLWCKWAAHRHRTALLRP